MPVSLLRLLLLLLLLSQWLLRLRVHIAGAHGGITGGDLWCRTSLLATVQIRRPTRFWNSREQPKTDIRLDWEKGHGQARATAAHATSSFKAGSAHIPTMPV